VFVRYWGTLRAAPLYFLLAGCGRLSFEHAAALAAPGADATTDDATQAGRAFVVSGNGTQPTALLELDLATGTLTTVGTIPAAFGTLGGLAAWDANTLYAASGSQLVRITLSPFDSQMARTVSGNISSIERRENALFGVDEATDLIVTFDPTSGPIATKPLGVAASGGDVAMLSDGSWYYFSNATTQLYRFDDRDNPIAVGSPATGAPFVSGLVRDDADRLFVTSSGSDQVIPIDLTTGQLGAPVTLCLTCPMRYDLLSGDATRSR